MENNELFCTIAKRARKEADSMEKNAGYAGNLNDGGAREFRELVEAWECGLRGEVPPSLAKFHEISLKAEAYRQSRKDK